MNPVLMAAYNNLELTKAAVASVLAQDIPVELHFIDNGSTDGTWEWISEQPLHYAYRFVKNVSPLEIVNTMYPRLLQDSPYILGVPNDVRLPPNCYRELLRWPRGFVCASDNGRSEPDVRQSRAVSENTPMAVMLTRRWAYDAIVAKDGYFFDPGFFHYASDCDLALRMAQCGIRGVQVDIPFWHFGSASLRLSSERRAGEVQADRDRQYFQQKWGFKVDSLEYGQRPADLNFSVECK